MTSVSDRYAGADSSIDRHAVEYLELVGSLGRHDPDSVDFSLEGPPTATRRRIHSPVEIAARGRALEAHLRSAHVGSADSRDRGEHLAAQLGAIAARIDQLSGNRPSFDDELFHLFAVDSRQIVRTPATGNDHDNQVRAELARLLPGTGSLAGRLAAYQRRFVVPRGRLHAVVTRSVAACREQTRRFLKLPDGETLTVEYVADRPWSGYSLYRGGYRSVMQVNRAMPLSVNQVLNLACHEGYPGHHTYNSLREQHFVRARNRAEATALTLFSPEGFRAEAMAAAAASLAFEPKELFRLLRNELFPLAGLDPRTAKGYLEVCELVDRLSGATTLVVEKYLARTLPAPAAAEALQHDALMEHPEALLAYVDRYRGYSLAYTFGRDRLLSTLNDRTLTLEDRWGLLNQLITRTP